ncbi:MAG: preprotein translocase subunit SecA [Prevotellaceae bacterium]|jgi:preprotein translocase subunit SecA|nr:preprotein translocase subunit SecA [Prevotellaceae bacterium]
MSVLNSIIKLFFGSKSESDMKVIAPCVEKIKEVYPRFEQLSNDELRAESQRLRKVIADRIAGDEKKIASLREQMEHPQTPIYEKEGIGKEIDAVIKEVDNKIEEVLLEILPEAFSIVKDTARRFAQNSAVEVTASDFDRELATSKDFVTIEGSKALFANEWMAGGNMIKWDMVHYDVQLIGGVALHKGNVAEMATGEGKTLVATLPVFLNALAGKGVHVVTVNDYLARRDSEWMGPLYQFHGLSVDCIDKHQPNSDARRKAYLADITFGTNNEFGFDYLRDNMCGSPEELVQRKHHFAIVDEVDSVLIDDARTPLIISGPVPKGDDQMFLEYKPFVEKLYNAQRNLVTQLLSDCRKLLAEGKTDEGGLLLLRAFKALPKYKPLIKFLSEQGNKALLLKTENFYMQDNNKNMHKATDELFFVIDEKLNSVDLTDKGLELISQTVSNADFFVLPDIGNEIAELEKQPLSAEEKLAKKDALLTDYAQKSERVHTVHQLLKAYAMFEKDVEYVVMNNKVMIVDEQTGRILDGRRYSDGLHQAIEAKESVKVEAATQTFATITLQNYFRMYHKLSGMTGTAETEAGELWTIYKLDVIVIPTNRPIVRHDANDLVYKTKREKYKAVIEEIGRLVGAGRPVLVGTTSVEISEQLSKMLKLRGIKHNVLNAKQHQREAEIVAEAGRAGVVTIATNMAGRGTDIKLTPEVKAAGGLAIIGTERHESRRVDRQLRGRAGRQGDPGSSQFYVSLEDDLMRLFGSERIASLMDRMGLKEGEVIQHSMISRSIERAQRKVEENNFGIRKRLLEYDDVMNSQREVIYARRRHALYGERIDVDMLNMVADYTATLVEQNHGNLSFEEFAMECIRLVGVEPNFDETAWKGESANTLIDKLEEHVMESYTRRMDALAKQAYPVIKNVFETQGSSYENMVVPITDGYKIFQIPVNLKKAYETEGTEVSRNLTKNVMLAMIDESWKDHLREMDDLKQAVHNASYEQKDPLLIYKLESYSLFSGMLEKINREVLSMLIKAQIPLRENNAPVRSVAPKRMDMSRMQTGRQELVATGGDGAPQKPTPVHVEKTVGRNDPCPCGSGKKFKNCHGKEA